MDVKYLSIANELVGVVKTCFLMSRLNADAEEGELETAKAILWYRLLPTMMIPSFEERSSFAKWYEALPSYIKRLNTDIVWQVIQNYEQVTLQELKDELCRNGATPETLKDVKRYADEFNKIPQCKGKWETPLFQLAKKVQTIADMYKGNVEDAGKQEDSGSQYSQELLELFHNHTELIEKLVGLSDDDVARKIREWSKGKDKFGKPLIENPNNFGNKSLYSRELKAVGLISCSERTFRDKL